MDSDLTPGDRLREAIDFAAGVLEEDFDPSPAREAVRELELAARPRDRLLVNAERTVLVRCFVKDDGDEIWEVARRDREPHTWGPPVVVREEVAR